MATMTAMKTMVETATETVMATAMATATAMMLAANGDNVDDDDGAFEDGDWMMGIGQQ
jgi:hypothetical protein